MSADIDIEVGFVDRFTAVDLAAVCPGLMWSGRLPANQQMPYAFVTSTKGQDAEYYAAVDAGDSYLDFRQVTVKVWGVGKIALGEVMRKFEAAFDWKIFPVPHSTLKACRPLGPRVEEDPMKKSGEDVWVGILEYNVILQRLVP